MLLLLGASGSTYGGSGRSVKWAGALGFRDFPGLLVMKENRTGSHQTLLPLFCGSYPRIPLPLPALRRLWNSEYRNNGWSARLVL
jgi:hypothetical protein